MTFVRRSGAVLASWSFNVDPVSEELYQDRILHIGYFWILHIGYNTGKRPNSAEHKMITIRDICCSFFVDKGQYSLFNRALP